jgi:hypothetical protein
MIYNLVALATEYEVPLPPHVQQMMDLVGMNDAKPPSSEHEAGMERGSKVFTNLVARLLELGGARRAAAAG